MLKRSVQLVAAALILAPLVVTPPVHADRLYTACDASKSSLCLGLVALYEFEEDSDHARTSETGSARLLEWAGHNVGRTSTKKTGTYALQKNAAFGQLLHIPKTVGLSGAFTVSFWLNVDTGGFPSADGKGIGILSMRDGNGGISSLYPFLYVDRQAGVNRVVFQVRNAKTGAVVSAVRGQGMAQGAWYNVQFGIYPSPTSSEPLQQTVWISLNNETASTATMSWPDQPGVGTMMLGQWWTDATWEYGAWKIDQLAVWGRPLNDLERSRLYNSGSGVVYPSF